MCVAAHTANDHTLSSLTQHTFTISQFLRVRNLGTAPQSSDSGCLTQLQSRCQLGLGLSQGLSGVDSLSGFQVAIRLQPLLVPGQAGPSTTQPALSEHTLKRPGDSPSETEGRVFYNLILEIIIFDAFYWLETSHWVLPTLKGKGLQSINTHRWRPV